MWNPHATISKIPLGATSVLVVDNVLARPEDWVQLAVANRGAFKAAGYNAFPGLELGLPTELTRHFLDLLREPMREAFQVRRVVRAHSKLAMVTTPEAMLKPLQTIPHVDNLSREKDCGVVAAVLYLFRDSRLGGTNFYRPCMQAPALAELISDAESMPAEEFHRRHGVPVRYPGDSDARFERLLSVAATWNRLIVYPGNVHHSGAIAQPELLHDDPLQGRLTINVFITCRRAVRG